MAAEGRLIRIIIVGLGPLLTAFFRFCPAYLPIKLNTGAPSEEKK